MKSTRHVRGTNYNIRGFMLIEVMIAVVIVGILASIAYPSYRQYVLRSNRAEAKAILMESAQFMERYFTTNNTYVNASVPSPASPKGSSGDGRKYIISFTTGEPTTNTFTLQAVRNGSQTADTCGTLTLNQVGTRTPTTAGCW